METSVLLFPGNSYDATQCGGGGGEIGEGGGGGISLSSPRTNRR